MGNVWVSCTSHNYNAETVLLKAPYNLGTELIL